MAVYTDITDAEVRAFLADYDLGVPTCFKGIAEGVENSNFLLETAAGRYVLTVYERRVRADQLPFFLGLTEWLASRGFPCAPPIADRDGRRLKSVRGKPAALAAFLRGQAVRHPTLAHCREAGEGLARLHLAARGFPARRANDLGPRAWPGLFAGLAARAEALKPGLAAAIEADLALIAHSWPAGLPEGIIHADYFPDNVFFAGGRFAGAIDFYFAAWDTLAYDIAVALNAWCFAAGGDFDIAAAGAFVEGYRRRRPLAAEETAALPLLARGAAMRFFLTRLSDWGEVPPGALVRPRDPLEYERKLAAHRSAAGAGGWARLGALA